MKEVASLWTLQNLIIKEYYEQLYPNKFDILDDMGQNPQKTQITKTGSRRNGKSGQTISRY